MTEITMRTFVRDTFGTNYIESEFHKCYNEKTFADCQLVSKGHRCKDGTGMVSSVMMCAASPLLRQVLGLPGDDHEDTVILLPDWPLEVVDKAIDFIYHGILFFRNSDLLILTQVSDLLENHLGVRDFYMHTLHTADKCFRCKCHYSSEEEYLDHLQMKHIDLLNEHNMQHLILNAATDVSVDDMFVCQACSTLVVDAQTRLYHRKTARSKIIKHFKECRQTFEEEKNRIKAIIASPVAPDLPTCDVCRQAFKFNFHLKQHKKTAHKVNGQQTIYPRNNEDPTDDAQNESDKPRSLYELFGDKKWRECAICERHTLVPATFIAHIFSHIEFAEIVNKEEPDKEIYKCDQMDCNKQFDSDMKKMFLKHKYGECELINTTKLVRKCIKLNTRLINVLEKYTLGDLKCVEEKLLNDGKVVNTVTVVDTNQTEEIDTEGLDASSSRRLSSDASYSTSNRTHSGAASSDSNSSNPVKCIYCKRVFKSKKQHDRADRHDCITQQPEEVIEEDKNPDPKKRNSYECKVCIGPLKPVLKDKHHLMAHYLLGHYQKFFKKNKRNHIKIEKFPWTCIYCIRDKKPNPMLLKNWEDVILHLGKIHERLYYALKHDPDFGMGSVMKFLFPERDRNHKARKSASRTPEKRKNAGSPATSPEASVSQVESLSKCGKRLLEEKDQDFSNSPKKHKGRLSKSISDEELILAEKEAEKNKPGLTKKVSDGQTSWEEEMNRARTFGKSSLDSTDDQSKKRKVGLTCNSCEETFPTKENLRLHTCESLIDQRDLNESTTGFRKSRSSNSSADHSYAQFNSSTHSFNHPSKPIKGTVENTSPPRKKQSKKMATVKAKTKDLKVSQTCENFEMAEEPIAMLPHTDTETVKITDYVVLSEEQPKGEKEKEPTDRKHAINRPVSSNDREIEESDHPKCDRCLSVFSNKQALLRHIKCKYCGATCVNNKTHRRCRACKKCYTEGVNDHYACEVCEKICYKNKSEREKHRNTEHDWDDLC